MNIFKFIAYILNKKVDILSGCDSDERKEFSVFMVQRWLSMYSDDFCKMVNIPNWLYVSFEDKLMYNKLMIRMLPKVPNRKIHYVKKSKKPSVKVDRDVLVIESIANAQEMSKREVRQMIDLGLLETKEYRKQTKE